ncbi:PHA-granule associated protein 4 [Cupriavidus basilensis]|uniref:PHA-granule associated protein 4 n=1 Tax=Cupriavidus basilensis TaxID=68895 RepID=UPI00157ABB48|nr:PHA-granule associated protein 4 [Cupriavidus basilensis]NUA27792.1 PHA-granule associated protein 4 [Cupriavidus basilensis]
MATARAGTKGEALRLLGTEGVTVVELDYEAGWQDAIELGRLGQKAGIRVEYRGQENIAVKSPTALVAGLMRPKTTFRQRNLYCQFELTELPVAELDSLEAKASKLGDYILAGCLMRGVDSVWTE